MTLPGDLATVQVTGRFLDPAGSPLTGEVAFTPTAEVTDATGRVVIPDTGVVFPLSAQGTFISSPLVATDSPDLQPEAWSYVVTVTFLAAPGFSLACLLPQAVSPVDLSALI